MILVPYSISKSSVNFVGCAVRRLAVLIVLSRRCSLAFAFPS
jgi:hypothetical protein